MNLNIKYLKQYFLICTFLCVTVSIKAQNNLADSLFRSSNYYYAGIEYERLAFSANDKNKKADYLLQKLHCKKLLGNFSEAAQIAKRIRLPGLNDSLLMTVLYEQAFCLYLAKEFKQAESAVIQFEFQQKTKSFSKDCKLLKILILNELRKWDDAKNCLFVFIDNNFADYKKDSLKQIATQLYSKNNLPRLRKKKTAFLLNFVPGMGLIYAGSFSEGMLNFIISATSLTYGAWQIYTGYYLTGYLTGSVLLEKFYFGGRRRSEFLIEKHNYLKSNDFNTIARKFILEIG